MSSPSPVSNQYEKEKKMNCFIAPNHPIFQSEAYQRDVHLVEVLDTMIRPTAFLLLSDGNSFVIGRNRLDLSAWVWTGDDIGTDALRTVCDLLHIHFAGRDIHFTAKEGAARAMAAHFAQAGYQVKGGMGLIAYTLHQVIMPEDKGPVRPARMDELDTLTQLTEDFLMACFGNLQNTDCRAQARRQIEAGTLRVLEHDGRIVSMVNAAPKEPGGHTRIGMVYTVPGAQGRGCAKWLTAKVCEDELTRCPWALLYADADNPRSNAAYRRIGFEPMGVMREMKLVREEISS